MSLNLSLNLQQQQKMVMTMQMHQAFQLLQLTGQELENALLEEIRENPALELEESDRLSDTELHRLELERSREQESLEERNGVGEEHDIDWDTLIEAGKIVIKSGVAGGYVQHEMPPIEENYASQATLYEHLMEQFRLELSTDGERLAGEFILASLDGNGFLDTPLEEIAMETNVDMDDVEGAILIIRELEPVGCGAQNMVESLIFQAESAYPEDPFFSDLIRNHLADFELKKYDEIGAAADMHPEDVEEYHSMMLGLNPRPGSILGGVPQPIIKPDVKVFRVGEEWKVVSTDDGVPKVRISPTFLKQMREASLERTDKNLMEDFRKKAEFFMHALLRREQTIVRVMRSVLSRQLEYFEFGEEYLRPLALRQVSEDTELHESTISRSTVNKYVEIPNGIFELKWFFCSGVKGLYGDEYASQSIQFKIRRFVEHENRQKPFSDQSIQKKLSDEGIQIARRTISKYRESIGIPSSRARKQRYAVQAKN